MKKLVEKTHDIYYIGVDDTQTDLFEGQYPIPDGVTYNSYVIRDKSIALFDTVDPHKCDEWMENLADVLQEDTPQYLIISHMEPDHAGCLCALLQKYPAMTLVGSSKALGMLGNYFEQTPQNPTLAVKEGDTLCLGEHTLHFIMAPMVHWPEVMMTYEETDKVLFSADAFGKFGLPSIDEPWADEARRYYVNICGKFGAQVVALLKKAKGVDIQTIAPLHGPILTGNLTPYLTLYEAWGSYTPEEHGVLIAYGSMYGNTAKAAMLLAQDLVARGEKVATIDIVRDDMAEAVARAFEYDRLVLAAPTQDGALFVPMQEYICHLKAKNLQNRRVYLMENGSWGPVSGKLMRASLAEMKGMDVAEKMVTIRGGVSAQTKEDIAALATLIAE